MLKGDSCASFKIGYFETGSGISQAKALRNVPVLGVAVPKFDIVELPQLL
jgi:hypothetical protein